MPLIHASPGIVERCHQANSQPNPLTARDHAVLEWMGIDTGGKPASSSSVGQSRAISESVFDAPFSWRSLLPNGKAGTKLRAE
jgi:hypothetical protein